MMLQLLQNGEHLRTIPDTVRSLSLGWEDDNDVVVDEPSVSGHHARLVRREDGSWWLEDLDSTNGTWLQGVAVTREPVRIPPGQPFEIGLMSLCLLEVADEPEPAATVADKPLWRRNPAELIFTALGLLHAFLAKWIPVGIRALVRWQGKVPLRLRLGLGFVVLALVSAWAGWKAVPAYWEWTAFPEENFQRLRQAGMQANGERVAWLGRISALLCLLTAGLCAWRHRVSWWMQKAAAAFYLLLWLSLHVFFIRVPSVMNSLDVKGFPNSMRNEYWIRGWGTWLPALIPPGLLLLGVARRSTRAYYTRAETPAPLGGDLVYESLRTGGPDPRMRSSSYWSSFVFFMVLVFPFLMRGCGWEEPYGLIKGSGDPVVEMVRVTRRKEQPQKKLIVNNWSPYIFERMRIDDIKVMQDLDEQSQNTYEIARETTGKLGEGGGKTGGWPDGMEGATVRFIRIQHGGDWDQNMSRNADANLLRRLNQITGFPVARDGEGRTVNRLRMFPQSRKPPFVFLTGSGNLSFSQSDVNTLRWYTLEEGGMIFATHGGGAFGPNFRRELNRIFPGYRLIDIPNDDPIYQAPFLFPGGAPPLWQQDGSRSLGIRHEGRWVVFYHPGDLSDAWRDGHSGATPEVAEQAYRMAVNVMYYAFNMYHARHFGR